MSTTSRRTFLTSLAASAATTAFTRDWSGRTPERYPDPDVIALEPAFQKYIVGNSPIRRLHTGMLWAEGPAWNGTGNYLMWSDIPNNAQMRYLPEDGHVSVMRNNANNSNGNTFDWQGRQVSCEHATRRVVRYEPNGSVTVLADKFEGKPLNAPNDVVVHPDGGVWFTDPGYGSMGDYEGNKGELQLKEAVYRIATDGKIAKVTEVEAKPNGLCFSADYKKLYVVDTGEAKNIRVYEVKDGATLSEGKEFAAMKSDASEPAKPTARRIVNPDTRPKETLQAILRSGRGGSDGIRCDVDGNIWSTAGWAGRGFDGVHTFSPEGQRIGLIRLPETAGNLCFGGAKRNRLFIVASQSLYSLHVNTSGAHFC